jgi:WhiB family transcriptional regulator, redox-sensing transcriptional regulator
VRVVDLEIPRPLWTSSPLAELVASVPAWMDRARCRDADPDVFFPPKGGAVGPARSICADCPVTDECLTYALSFTDEHDGGGVWAGTSRRERAALRRSDAA